MKVASTVLAFLLMAFIFVVPSYAQSGAINGQVLDLEGKPIQGATIVIERVGINQKFEVKTDAKGSFVHAGLQVAPYNVTLMMPDGRMGPKLEGIRVRLGTVVSADFDLRTFAPKISAEEQAKMDAEAKSAEDMKNAFQAGIAAMSAKNYPEAARLFQQAAEKDATQHVIFGNLGGALTEVKKYDDAVAAYKKAIELKPDEAAYYNNLGVVYGNMGKIDDAVASLQKAAELNPANAAQSYFNLGAVLTNRGRTKDAGEAFKKAIEYNPNMAQAYYQLGISYFGTPGTMAEAVPVLEKFLTMQPSGPDADAAKQLIEAARATAPTGFKSEKAIAEEKAKAEKEAKAAADREKAEKAKAQKKGR